LHLEALIERRVMYKSRRATPLIAKPCRKQCHEVRRSCLRPKLSW
jgi:hypothetical protein